MLIAADGSLMSESLYLLLMLVLINLLLDARRSATSTGAVALGAIVGLAALTRGEGLVYLPFLVIPRILTVGGGDLRRRGVHAAIAVAVCLAVIAPAAAASSARFDRFVFISDNATTVVRGANCDTTLYGPKTGFWDYNCLGTTRAGADSLDEAAFGSIILHEGLNYAGHHVGRLLVIAPIRVGRTWGLVSTGDQLRWEAGESRTIKAETAGWYMYLALLVLAIGGGWISRRTWRSWWVLLGPVVVVVLVSAVTYGNQRFRIAAEPTVLILAAVALLRLGSVIGGRASVEPSVESPSLLGTDQS
jgi:hypothetical protein